MSNWFHPAPSAPTTTALTEAFMQMDAALSTVEALVGEYRAICSDGALDTPWASVRAKCEAGIDLYTAVTSDDHKPRQHEIDETAEELRSITIRVDAFRPTAVRALDAARRVVEAEAEADRQARAAAASRAMQLADDAARALSSVSTRLQAARSRREGVGAAQSVLLKEFTWASCEDVVESYTRVDGPLMLAADCLARGRSARHNGDPAEALDLAKKARCALNEADRLIDGVPERLRVLREIQADPNKHAEKVRFALRDAQMFCVDHHLEKQWASVLDAQLKRIETHEAALANSHPDYWTYTTGLKEVNEFIATVVARMRENIKGANGRSG